MAERDGVADKAKVDGDCGIQVKRQKKEEERKNATTSVVLSSSCLFVA